MTNLIKQFLSVLFIVAIGINSHAQDIHFSQFFSSPLTLNPALTGNFDGNLRVAGIYRNQWANISNAYNTKALSVDFPILTNILPQNDRFGLGFTGYTDQQANASLKNNFASISAAYHKGLDEDGNNSLSLGFQGVYSSKSLDVSSLTFEDMLRSNGFTGLTNETFKGNQLNVNYFDLNAGLMYSGVTANNANFYLGASIYHILQPKETFLNGQYYLGPRYTVHGGAYFPLSPNVMLHTSALYQNQSGASEAVLGGALGYNLGTDYSENVTMYAGAWLRFGDAIIPYAGMEYGSFRLGLSYDVTSSNLQSVNQSRGGFELSLIYINKPSGEHNVPCPKF